MRQRADAGRRDEDADDHPVELESESGAASERLVVGDDRQRQARPAQRRYAAKARYDLLIRHRFHTGSGLCAPAVRSSSRRAFHRRYAVPVSDNRSASGALVEGDFAVTEPAPTWRDLTYGESGL